ncbi:Phage protein [Candidatus Arthromitus sp. SFB-mouse-NL]|uniref:phage head closure protein n=1 Tax=Candidatus Arthromitus sp. SFB-mouse-NL TaxID=1508644 RepID=UPI000499C568|nr:phage head closure protein [Candidatus Arthromitus sp. SFB-mouse-NL]AID44737.1 Phage protein [Candidatus Arthromitus sp. SFB-mouse-NL]
MISNTINIGKLRHRISIIDYMESENDLGEIIKIPVIYKKLWAKVENKTGKEGKYINDKVNNIEYLRIKIRYYKDINTNMMIRFKDKDYFITSIDNYNYLNKEMTLEVASHRT